MKKLRISTFVTVLLGWTMVGWAADQAPAAAPQLQPANSQAQAVAPVTAPTAAAKTPTSEKTQHDFEDLLVQGKYHFSDEAVTTVEEDKVLDSLLGVRTDFKDKIEQSAGRY